MLFSLNFCSAIDAEWWNNDWQYRKPIDVKSNTNNLSDYQIKLTINLTDDYINGRINETGKDIRFVNSSNQEISFWIETMNITGGNKLCVKNRSHF